MMIQKCAFEDCPFLSLMNKQLIEDEKSDNPMTIPQLEQRMQGFLGGEYEAYYLKDQDTVLGYALVKTSSSPKYLRQFFIRPEYRRKGFGTLFFHQLMDALKEEEIDIEVFTWNQHAKMFWESLGFLPRSIYMRYSPKLKI